MITLSFVDRRRRPCDNEQNKIVLAKYTVSSLVQLFTLSVVTEVWTLITGESSLVDASLSFPPRQIPINRGIIAHSIFVVIFVYIYAFRLLLDGPCVHCITGWIPTSQNST